ncbi:DNA mismatch repair protein MutS, partial [Marinospirillum sp.]|uniref:DNA mismatch repair protein MutS n=1 Tax=Marinospirillum sp. TaxID=2183934 RepID=UPI003A8ACFEE
MAGATLTPMMQQYYDIKGQYPDCLLLYRMGDFYEMFNDDAVTASRILGLTLTKRNNGTAGQTPLCGFPYHAAERYIPKLVQEGLKTAVCEQIEDPKTAKGVVKRDVVEVITSGTALNESALDAKENNFLCCLCQQGPDTALAALDITTGEFTVCCGDSGAVAHELYRLRPKEIVYNKATPPEVVTQLLETEKITASPLDAGYFEEETASALLVRRFGLNDHQAWDLRELPAGRTAAGAVLAYALDLKKNQLDHLQTPKLVQLADYMVLDAQTLRNLELVQPLNSDDYKATLLAILDTTATSMGGRKLRQWICHPLIRIEPIQARLDAVESLLANPVLQQKMQESLREISDLERICARVGTGRANARDLLALGKSLLAVAALEALCVDSPSALIQTCRQTLGGMEPRATRILDYLREEAPLTLREGGLIQNGASPELDALNEGIRDAREWLSGLEQRERTQLGISTLKVGFNKVFGYYMEVTRQHSEKIPANYIRKQTLSNAERFISPEMKEYESRILNAESQINELEYNLFCQLREEVHNWRSMILEASGAIATLDTLLALTKAATRYGYNKPTLGTHQNITIREGFHPVISALQNDYGFICNDTLMHPQENQIMLITGPNMAGKSTYLRQTGIIVLMAQMGCYVPAKEAEIGICDRIFTRVGASDRLARGQSTFMVEMVETANILLNATPRSLILLDEIGRGTSTFDGLSLAWSIVEQLHNHKAICGKTLFATHYHELCDLEKSLPRLRNFHISVHEKNGKLLFLRKILPGACDSSYGIQVAAMAGVPAEVIARAKKILLR